MLNKLYLNLGRVNLKIYLRRAGRAVVDSKYKHM